VNPIQVGFRSKNGVADVDQKLADAVIGRRQCLLEGLQTLIKGGHFCSVVKHHLISSPIGHCVKAIMQWFPHCAQLDLCHTTFGSFTRTKASSQSSRAKSSVYAEVVSGHFLFSMGVHAKAARPAWRH